MDIDELQAHLTSTPAIWESIYRDCGIYTVALFSVSNATGADRLSLEGTGTLVSVGDLHFILTAAHVWYDRLRHGYGVGISLREGITHNYLLKTQTIQTSGPSRPSSWNEWGADFIFLRIPAAHVSDIQAFRVFYRLPAVPPRPSTGHYIENDLLIGAPHALGTHTDTNAEIQIVAFSAGEIQKRTFGFMDYLDTEVDMQQSKADSFGGVSGGGLWTVRVYFDPVTESIDSDVVLIGVAFWELGTTNGRGVVRCHSLKDLLASLPEYQ